MSQHDMIIDNAGGATFRADINSALQALVSNSKGTARPSTVYAGQLWIDENTPSTTRWTIYLYDGVSDIKLGELDVTAHKFDVAGALHGQCRLAKSGANLVLLPHNGNRILINGDVKTLPAAGVSLAPTLLAPDTLYYIYLYDSGGTLTLEASATGHSPDTTTGVEIKTGDATRTLVGMARTISGPAFADTAAQRFVISWFNRGEIESRNSFAANRTTTSAAIVELSASERAEFLTWGPATTRASVIAANSAVGLLGAAIGIDGGAAANVSDGCLELVGVINTGQNHSVGVPGATLSLSEGYHYATLSGNVGGGGTGTFLGGATAPVRCSVGVRIQG